MPVIRLSLAALSDAERAAWSALAAVAVEPNPFFEPEFVLPAARHLADGVELAVALRDGEWIGAMPVRRSRWKGLPVAAFGPWVHPYCFLGAPLLAPGREDEALAALLGELRARSALVPLEQLPADGPVAAALARGLAEQRIAPVQWHSWERATLRRRPQNDYVAAALNAKRARELRRQRRLLGEQVGPVTVLDAAADPAAIDGLLALEASGWKGRAGTAMDAAGHGAFLRAACAAFAAAGRLQVVTLRAGEETIAAQCNFLAGAGGFCFKLGIDAAHGRYSPGVLLQLANVDLFHDTPELQWADSCADPRNQMINRLWPDRRPMTTLLVPGTGLRGVAGRAQAGAAVSFRLRKQQKETA